MSMKFSSRYTRSIRTLSTFLLLSVAATLNTACATDIKQSSARHKKTAKTVQGDEFANFAQWSDVSEFIDQMVAKNGFNKKELQAVLNKTHYVDSAIQLDQAGAGRQAEKLECLPQSLRRAGPHRCRRRDSGMTMPMRLHARRGISTACPQKLSLAYIGVETVYGRNTGNFRVMDAITTLAFAYPDTPNRAARTAYFRGELENTLLFARDSAASIHSHCLVLMPAQLAYRNSCRAAFVNYAVDFDGNGKIDLRNSPIDAIGSVAHFLVATWLAARRTYSSSQPSVDPVAKWMATISSAKVWKRNSVWLNSEAAGVTPAVPLPNDMQFGLVDLQNGADPYRLLARCKQFLRDHAIQPQLLLRHVG
jgi:membrane-bound lytic murein transglycosylase B